MLLSSSKTDAAGWLCLIAAFAVVGWDGGAASFAESRRKASSDACLADPVCLGFYEEARRLSKAGDLQAAVVAYQAAYRRQSAPWLLINLGRTLHKLGRPQEALTHYQRYTSAEPNGPADRQEMVREYTAQAEKALAEKSASDKPAPELLVDTTAAPPQEPAPPPLAVPPPVVTAPPPDKAPLPPPDEAPLPPKSVGMPAYFWAGLGVGGALVAAGAVTGGVTLARSGELQATAYASPATDALLGQQSQIRTLAAVTDALLAIGGATVAAVTVAALVQRHRHGPGKDPGKGTKHPAARPATAALWVGLGGVAGHF